MKIWHWRTSIHTKVKEQIVIFEASQWRKICIPLTLILIKLHLFWIGLYSYYLRKMTTIYFCSKHYRCTLHMEFSKTDHLYLLKFVKKVSLFLKEFSTYAKYWICKTFQIKYSPECFCKCTIVHFKE